MKKIIGCLSFSLLLLHFGMLSAQEESRIDFTKVEVIITNETTVNSPFLEFSPSFYEDGIVFISNQVAGSKYKVKDTRTGKNIMSIFISRRDDDGKLKAPEPFSEELLSIVNEGPLAFNETNDQIFFTRNNMINGKKIKASDGIIKLKIFNSRKVGGEWTLVTDNSFNDNESNTCHPAISVGSELIYFASDRPGGYGGMDLYVAKREGTSWSRPENLGPEINTAGDDVFPFVHADGTLYFASDGHGGKGGLDVLFAKKNADLWTAPVLFKPINSKADDFGLIIDRDKKNGYLSSNRGGGLGEDDIYSFYIIGELDDLSKEPKDVAKELSILVRDSETGEPIEDAQILSMMLDEFSLAKAIITDEDANDKNLLLKIPFDEGSKSGFTASEGDYNVFLDPGNYIFKMGKEGYQTKRVVALVDSEEDNNQLFVELNPMREEEPLEEVIEAPSFLLNNPDGIPAKIEEGTVFRLPNIYYNFNDASIRPDARVDLDALADFLVKYPDIEIELSSHTDSRGTKAYNLDLSQRRAENAVDYLVRKGISPSKMVAVGYGESQLRNNCADGVKCSEEEHQYNRRTEVKILRMSKPINLKIVSDATPPSSQYESGDQQEAGIYGDFLVVAGSFKVYENAQSRLDLLLELGFRNAKVNFFDKTGMYSVIAGNFSTRAEANDMVSRLKRDYGIGSFVKR